MSKLSAIDEVENNRPACAQMPPEENESSIEMFSDLDSVEEYRFLIDGLNDVKAGRVIDGEKAISDVRKIRCLSKVVCRQNGTLGLLARKYSQNENPQPPVNRAVAGFIYPCQSLSLHES